MNTRFKMALLLRSGESGFAIVVAVSLGLIMILVGLTMTMRSQGDQVVSSSQKAAEKSLAVAEKGIAHYTAFLNSNRTLALYPDCRATRNAAGTTCSDPASTTNPLQMSWSNVSTIPEIASACNSTASLSDIETIYASNDWQAVDPNDASKGQYRLVSYQLIDVGDTFWPATGELIVEGRLSATDDPGQAISRVSVDIGIQLPNVQNVPIPGLWIGGNSTEDPDALGGNNKVAGDVLVNNCDLTDAQMADMQTSLVGSNRSIKKTNMQIPDVPTMPALLVPDAFDPVNNPPTPGTIPLQFGGSASLPSNNSGGITLPRINGEVDPLTGHADQTIKFNDQDTYVYSIDGDIPSGTTITVTPGEKVVIFLSGSIEKNVEIYHCGDLSDSQCNPIDFKIYGTGGWGEQICMNGNRRIEAFILAPEYRVGVNGGGGGAGGIKGALWAKTWTNPNSKIGSQDCGSNSQNILLEQTGDWNDIGLTPQYLPPPISGVRKWKQTNATEDPPQKLNKHPYKWIDVAKQSN